MRAFVCLAALTCAVGTSYAEGLSHLTIEGIEKHLTENPSINTVEEFVSILPREFKEHYILMTGTESAQLATADRPRVILQSLDSSTVFAFSTVPEDKTVEMIRFEPKTSKFEFHRIDFVSEKPKVLPHEQSCLVCHGKNPRPNWDAYESWPNALPFNKDRLYVGSEEDKAMKRIFSTLKEDPRFSQLLPPQTKTGKEDTRRITAKDGTEVEQGGEYVFFPHPNAVIERQEGQAVALFDQLTKYNALKIAQEVVESRNTGRFQYALLAVVNDCATTWDELRAYLPKPARDTIETFHGMSAEELEKDTEERRRSLPAMKVSLQKQNLKSLIKANARHEGITYSTDELKRKITQELLRRNMTVSHFKIDERSEINDSEEAEPRIARYRYLLEPEGIQVGKWSMSVKSRSLTYTFADLTRFYRTAIRNTLEARIEDKSCAALKANSLKAYAAN